ncbi:hypothetical protein CC79DRAFT_921360 [Sarocladium strictum]
MKSAALTLSLLAGAVTAEQATSAPKGLLSLASSLNIGAVNAQDDGAQVCLDASTILLECGEQWGDIEDLDNASQLDEDEVLGCACCDGSRPIASDFDACSSYMVESMTLYSSEASAFGDLATICSSFGSCSGSAGGASASATGSGSSRPTSAVLTVDEDPTTITSADSAATATPGVAVTECNQMLDMFSSCILETPRFADLGFKSQAECYCCASTRGQTTGTLTWTDEIDQYASTCWDWAETDATDDTWNYASSFATFCDNFSGVCNGMSVTADSAGETEAETGSATTSQETDAVTVTVTNNDAQATETDAAAGLRAGCAGGVVALVAGLMML